MIQFSAFGNGGFVLHKIMLDDKRYTAWFDADGELIDAERILELGETRRVRLTDANVRRRLTVVGRRYVHQAKSAGK